MPFPSPALTRSRVDSNITDAPFPAMPTPPMPYSPLSQRSVAGISQISHGPSTTDVFAAGAPIVGSNGGRMTPIWASLRAGGLRFSPTFPESNTMEIEAGTQIFLKIIIHWQLNAPLDRTIIF